MNIAPQHVENLIRLGYTAEEATFLYVAATHSGYFTHRQFLNFAGIQPGKHSQKFLEKLLSKKHATYHAYPSGGHVYHVFARQVFGAMERDDLRTRRRHQLEYIKTRLVTLDFVLANFDCNYLETETEKVPFFESLMGVDRSLLPCKMYRSKVSSRTTVRYFVDRYPIFVRGPLVPASRPCFTYIDAGSATLRGLATHLNVYRALLRSLPAFDFLYVAPRDQFVVDAGQMFSQIVLPSKGIPTKDHVLRYFKLRKQWEAGGRVAAVDVVFLNAARTEMNNTSVETQYRKWKDGTIKDSDVIAPERGHQPEVNGMFATRKCGESLSVFYRSHGDQGESGRHTRPATFSPTVSRGNQHP